MPTINNNVLTFQGALQHKRGSSDALNASDYIPKAGEIIVATDTGLIKAGDGTHKWSELPSPDTTEISNSYDEETSGKALDATKGKDLNDRLALLEGFTSIDCGEITAPESGSGD